MPQFIYTMKGLGKVHPPDIRVLDDIWLSFLPGAKIGVLGLNGAGKSSLLRIMAGEDQTFLGEAYPAGGISVGFLQQEPRLDAAKTVLGNVEEGVAPIKALLTRYDELNAKLGEDLSADEMDKVLDEQSRIQDKIDAANAWDLDSRLELAMDALRLPPPDADVTTLSGGERRRVALCRLLLQSPDLLLLDEPTNHLDAESVAWLERFLKDYAGTVVAVTHDRYFLDNVAGWILELDRGRGIPWEGQLLVVARAEAEPAAAGGEGRDQAAADARARARMDPDVAARAAGQGQGATQRLRRPAARGHRPEDRDGRNLHRARSAAGRRRRRSAQPAQGLRRQPPHRRPQLHAAARRHRRRHRSERRRQDDAVPDDHRAGTARRRHAADWRDRPDRLRRSEPRSACRRTRRVWEEISGGHDEIELGKRKVASRAYVSWFNFKGAGQQRKVGSLSGGERNRVHLAKLLKKGSNLLLLDEPTNDLDVDTLRALEEALLNFAGCAVVISHDRWFLDRIATHMLAFEGDSEVVWFEGNYQDYEADRKRRLGAEADQPHRIKYRKLTR